MPSGPTHRSITKIVAVSALGTLFWLDFDQFVALEAGIVLTMWATPDLDIHNRLGALGELIGFDAYKRAMPHRAGLRKKDWKQLYQGLKSRGKEGMPPWQIVLFSHIPWIGTGLRTAMLLFPLVLTLAMFDLHTWIKPEWVGLIWHGMSGSDAVHGIADILCSNYKEFNPGWWFNQPTEQDIEREKIKQAKRQERKNVWKPR